MEHIWDGPVFLRKVFGNILYAIFIILLFLRWRRTCNRNRSDRVAADGPVLQEAHFTSAVTAKRDAVVAGVWTNSQTESEVTVTADTNVEDRELLTIRSTWINEVYRIVVRIGVAIEALRIGRVVTAIVGIRLRKAIPIGMITAHHGFIATVVVAFV